MLWVIAFIRLVIAGLAVSALRHAPRVPRRVPSMSTPRLLGLAVVGLGVLVTVVGWATMVAMNLNSGSVVGWVSFVVAAGALTALWALPWRFVRSMRGQWSVPVAAAAASVVFLATLVIVSASTGLLFAM